MTPFRSARNSRLLTFAILLGSLAPLLPAPAADFAAIREELMPSDAQLKGFDAWLKQRRAALDAGSKVVQTAAGPIEYKRRGHGPVVICLHGGFGGYDQAYLMGSFLVGKGFTVIALSRPGYLRTPISVGKTNEQQADATVALMDALHIDRAAIFGFSAGTPIAFQVGVRHPERVSSVVLTGLGLPADQAPYYKYVALFLQADVGIDILPYGLYLLAQLDLRATADIMFTVDSDLKGAAAARRADYIFGNKAQRTFLKEFAITLTPMSDRRKGALNDVSGTDSPWDTYAKKGQLAAFNLPLLVIDAKNDGNGSYPQTVQIVRKIPVARLLTVKGSGHFIWLGQNTAEWEGRMITFLKKHQP